MVLKDMSDQFAAVARSLRSEPNELETLSRAIEVAVEVVPSCDYAGITMVRDRHRIQTPAATAAVARRCDQLQLELDEGPCLDVLRETEAISCVDLLREDRWPTWAPRVAQE
ncbi:MAG TPA: antitermination regulator, partial [Propionibacteriaceae bacterium]